MSYWTHVEIICDDSGNGVVPDVDRFVECAKGFVQEEGWHDDVLTDLRAAFEGLLHQKGAGFNKAYHSGVEALMQYISKRFPKLWFGVRGFGEEFRDVWVREFRNGKVTYSRGPFDSLF